MPVYIKNNKAVTKDTRQKKAKRAENMANRIVWTIKPITHVKESAKLYNRKKLKKPGKFDM